MYDIAIVTDSLKSCQHLDILLFINNVNNIDNSVQLVGTIIVWCLRHCIQAWGTADYRPRENSGFCTKCVSTDFCVEVDVTVFVLHSVHNFRYC